MPVGLLKLLKPLGHCGHLKLHEVVGSMENEMGIPQCIGLDSHLDT